MPSDYDKDAYPEPPRQTPAVDKKSSLPDPGHILANLFTYAVDTPVTAFREAIDRIRAKNKIVYYHQKFNRVPDITECVHGDYVCYFEADMQWRRDMRVDQEIVKVIQERLGACQQREGQSYRQNCAHLLRQFEEVSKNFQSRYGDLGVYGNAKKCLMKQKERMIEAQAKAQTA